MTATSKVSQEKKQIRYVELVRVSSKGQSDRDTPALQRSALDKLAKSRPGVLVERIECLGGVSGAADFAHRPDLQRLATLARAKSFTELRCYHIDRLSRNSDPRERLAIYGMIQDAGAVIVDAEGRVTDPADDSGMGEMDFYLRSFFASQERKHILRKTRDGKRRVAHEGGWTGERLTYGVHWDKAGKAFRVDAAEAEVVKRIFGECAGGRSARQIADELSADSIASPRRRGPWRSGAVLRILRQKTYLTGELSVAIGGSAPISYGEPVAKIVDRALWDRVQLALDGRRVKPPGPWTTLDALLRGLAYCGTCGRSIHVTTSARRSRYRCSTAHGSSKVPFCGALWHRVAPTDAKVWKQLSETLTDRTLLAKATALLPAEDGSSSWKDQAANCKRLLKELLAHETLILRDHRRGKISDEAYERERDAIGSDRATHEQSLKVAEHAMAQAAQVGVAADALLDLMKEEQGRVQALIAGADAPTAAGMRRNLLQTYSFQQQRQLVERLVPRGGGYGCYLRDDGSVEIRGVLDRELPTDNLIRRSAPCACDLARGPA
jgi:DNA invertase Pin-like site-specific DNA recombinase